MKAREIPHLAAAVLLLALVAGFSQFIKQGIGEFPLYLGFAALIIVVAVASKKLMAHLLDADVEHRLWQGSRFGFAAHHHFKKEVPYGIILPLVFSLFSIGFFKLMTFLTYDSSAQRYRAAKRFGNYSYTEMTDWHNALIGAGGILGVLLLSFISYFPNLEVLSKMAALYAFSNMIPLSKLDGSQIFFGSRALYAALAVVTLIFLGYAIIL
ncbi:hypothetical protein HYZ97_03820 [Candidatus Pacearchaeota archaeon]|nr:hypothetical protein [Candidatus Pacearchaeota archaeon]